MCDEAAYKYVKKDRYAIYYNEIKNIPLDCIQWDDSQYLLLMEQIDENAPESIQHTVDHIFERLATGKLAPLAVQASINRYVHDVLNAN